jgi:hypothetical protein
MESSIKLVERFIAEVTKPAPNPPRRLKPTRTNTMAPASSRRTEKNLNKVVDAMTEWLMNTPL